MNESDPASDLLADLAPALLQWAALGDDTNVTRAAAVSGVSQPTLSRAMARWEREAGVALFRRVGREVQLTPEGALVAEAARAALEDLRLALAEAVGGGTPPVLTVGFLHSLGPSVVGELVSAFHAAEPAVHVVHHEGSGVRLVEELRGGGVDIAVLAPHPGEGFGWLPLGRQGLSLVMPTHHRLAGRDSIDLAEAADEGFLALDPRYSTRQLADALCAEAGFRAAIFLEADNAQTVRDYVASGLGVAILPNETTINPRVVSVPIASSLASREIGLAWSARRRQTPWAEAFRESARALSARYPGWADLGDG
jgi:LysR family transcriptional activator of glutamate synthase operon